MKYGICPLSIVPLHAEASDQSELVTQVLYGETLEVLENVSKWSNIRLDFDGYEGWIDNKQFCFISEKEHKGLTSPKSRLSSDMIDFITTSEGQLLSIPLGSNLNGLKLLKHRFDGKSISEILKKNHLIDTALLYLNAPYMWGGKTPFGIDCSGLTQMVYKLNGYKLMRDASEQSTQGEALSFIEESEAGDLAFFDNSEGTIIHVGIIMDDNYIIHAHGHVRIDRLDHIGIFNYEKRKHTHKLRVIKRII
jgi:gamma-D-glutamyl-L-lysine dipeptidyl-peptidase